MPTLTLGTSECGPCGGLIVLRLEEGLDGSTHKYAYCESCGLFYWAPVIRKREDFKDRFPKQPSAPPQDDCLKVEGLRTPPEGARTEVVERAKGHLSQFKILHGVKGFLFVDDDFLASRVEGEHYQRETDPGVIDYVKKTWVDHGVKDSIGTMYSPCEARPHCVIAPYT